MLTKRVWAAAAALAMALSLTACGGDSGSGSGSTSGSGDEPVTLTIWNNQTTGTGQAFWNETAALFMAEHPNVTIEIQAIQNEDLDGKLQTALASDDPPDVFLQRGGGKMRDMVDANQLLDITDLVDDITFEQLGQGPFTAMTYQDKIWAMPDLIQPGGIWYSKDLFAEAGITDTPTTMDELNAVVDKLKAAGITPIALGGKDAWPAAHWFYFFALRECPTSVLQAVATNPNLDDPCWLKAGEDLEAFAATNPFNEGFLTTPAQQGAGSSAGLLANHKAAMELMGSWNPGVIGSLTPDEQPLADLGWFPFPNVDGGQGAAGALMGGMGGYSCSAKAPAEVCAQFLNFFVSPDRQEAYYKAVLNPPLNKEAQSAVTEDYNKQIMEALNSATYVSDWLDTVLGQNIGNALNTAVVDMLAGNGDAQSIIDTANKAASKG
jgi:raffinose/stachyose/melibiose transport system substrate-binding protein